MRTAWLSCAWSAGVGEAGGTGGWGCGVWSTESHSQKRGPGVGLGGITPKEAGGRHRQAGLDVLGVIPAAYLATN